MACNLDYGVRGRSVAVRDCDQRNAVPASEFHTRHGRPADIGAPAVDYFTPANASVAKGLTQQYMATGVYASGDRNLTNVVTWASSATSKATIAAGGLATMVAAGSTVISATFEGVTGSTPLTVGAATLVSVAVTPSTATIAALATQQFTATGMYTDSSTANLTSSATWVSSDPTKATIAAGGLATGVAAGTSNITAQSGAVTSPAAVLTVS